MDGVIINLDAIEKVDKQALGITEGRIVHYQYESESGVVKCRPAVIVEAWHSIAHERGEVNLTVFTDWSNDAHRATPNGAAHGLEWKTSVPYHDHTKSGTPGGRLPGTYHFPER